MVKVLLVSDHPIARAGLAALLDRSTNLQVVGEPSIDQMAARADSLLPGVAVVEMENEDENGYA